MKKFNFIYLILLSVSCVETKINEEPSTEVSSKTSPNNIPSIEVAQKNYDYVNFDISQGNFDLIFVAGVMHHIPRESLRMEISKICGLLSEKGRLIIFEHNAYNPITRRLVSTCEFDVGAELISTRKLINQFKKAELSLQVTKKGYCLFFPPALKALSFFERFLRKIPLGGQYFVQFNKI